jgi:hypothetical protein
MKRVYPGVFVDLVRAFASDEQEKAVAAEILPESMYSAEFYTKLREHAQHLHRILERYCIEVGLTTSAATVRKMIDALQREGHIRERMKDYDLEFAGRLVDEMQSIFFFCVSPHEADYFKEPRRGWEKIIERFLDCVGDVEEARKCFALSRYAAAVFHSLQIVEVGLIELGTFIGVTDPKSGWTAVTNRLKKIVDAPHDKRSNFERSNYGFLEQLPGTVEALKNAWRNKISDAQGRLVLLTADFSPDVAEEILFATRARSCDG